MKKQKDWQSFHEQLALLHSRGLIIDDEKKALHYLKTIGYYRLSGYFYSFRQYDPYNAKQRLDNFLSNTYFDDVINLYIFDKKLRQIALDALERIEIALRVNIAYILGKYDVLAYQKTEYFDNNFNHNEWLERYQKLQNRSEGNDFVKHCIENYGDLPIWAACEIWDFGTMSILYQGMQTKDKDRIAKIYHLKTGKHLQSHIRAFHFIRNVCAHHARLWNKHVTFKANLKGLKDKEWHELPIESPFIYFCLIKRMLDIICPNSSWGERFLALLDEFPKIDNRAVSLADMGVVIQPRIWSLWRL